MRVGTLPHLVKIDSLIFVHISYMCYTKNVMRITLTLFLITGFIGVAVFGVFAMNHGSEHGHGGCIAATAQGIDCLKYEGVLSLIAFHLDAFRSFSTATFGDNIAHILLSLIALMSVIAIGIIARIHLSHLPRATYYRHRQFLNSDYFPSQRKFIRWLAFRENSPSMA